MSVEISPETKTSSVRCYAVRRVNPFLGVLQIIESEAGRATTANGVVWDIEVLSEQHGGWGSLNKVNKELAYHRYGLWSLEDGLVNRPLASQLDHDPLTQQCHDLIDCIRSRRDHLPFKLEDKRELWLFDNNNEHAIALLASIKPDKKFTSSEPKYWSASIGANGVPSQRRFPAANVIENLVKERAGFNIQKHWIVRHDDGSGSIENSHEQLSANIFPPFLLTENWEQPEQTKVASDYLGWIAPSILTLDSLSQDERYRMECSLNIQAISVEHHWHLYPEIIDENCIKAARVQCRMQNSISAGGHSHD